MSKTKFPSIKKFLREFFEKPKIPKIEPEPLEEVRLSISDELLGGSKPLSREEERAFIKHQLSLMSAEKEEARASNQHSLNIAWRNSLITLVSVLIAGLGVVMALVGVIVALAKQCPMSKLLTLRSEGSLL